MTRYNLTPQQENLLSNLVQLTHEGKLKETLVPIPIQNEKSGSLDYVLHLAGADSFRFKNISDFDRFCEMGFMTYRWNRQGIGKIFSLTRTAVLAVENEFEKPFTPPGPKHLPQLIVQAMNGSADAQSANFYAPDINTITADPILLHTKVEALAGGLLAAVHGKLGGAALIGYGKSLTAFKEAIYHGRLNAKEIQAYALKLSLFEEGTPFLLTVWPYLYPLLLIAEKRI